MFSAWGVNNKKVPNLYEMGLLTCFVTLEVEKSNFYRDLEGVLDTGINVYYVSHFFTQYKNYFIPTPNSDFF
jgi:hypothetical protein